MGKGAGVGKGSIGSTVCRLVIIWRKEEVLEERVNETVMLEDDKD